ncbi:Pho2p NDAI_0B03290 [Naumovozyma dairenensis CBS 421]|uniref:Homeobox domain-containing protein n=1 Tax=Naumovozyma dairenensis (strain ATCC 10597 / BCRC 20456 / CBS 421 / NBRC 0211 / NRRL Y-12639) TaxID=1071378 RepID=G0W6F2_NAUDC|nr:hypothetical protein NDAI_0B03290 [Naumovozyma dairenensis CBS 421]CCD23363.1 hypothetical protein NDAI_0B03290 [Naumovozyma dairenensis CBS 421]
MSAPFSTNENINNNTSHENGSNDDIRLTMLNEFMVNNNNNLDNFDFTINTNTNTNTNTSVTTTTNTNDNIIDDSASNITTNTNTTPNTNTNTNATKTKRKRAKGETLNILKQYFDQNPIPSLQERKNISKLTNMPEKNVRIWFQNRRAKLKKNGTILNIKKQQQQHSNSQKNKNNNNNNNNNENSSYSDDSNDNNSESNSNSDGSADAEDDINDAFFDRIPIDSNKNYYFIDSCSITVGSWNRMKNGSLLEKDYPIVNTLSNLSPISIDKIMANTTDLLILVSRKNDEINYFFSALADETKILFRIFFPLSSVQNCSLVLQTDNDILPTDLESIQQEEEKFGELKLTLTKSPTFAVYFVENTDDQLSLNQWSICEDFSEGKQVTDAFIGGSNLPHILKGLQNSLKFLNSYILDYKSTKEILPPSINTQSHLPSQSQAQSQQLQLHSHSQQHYQDNNNNNHNNHIPHDTNDSNNISNSFMPLSMVPSPSTSNSLISNVLSPPNIPQNALFSLLLDDQGTTSGAGAVTTDTHNNNNNTTNQETNSNDNENKNDNSNNNNNNNNNNAGMEPSILPTDLDNDSHSLFFDTYSHDTGKWL